MIVCVSTCPCDVFPFIMQLPETSVLLMTAITLLLPMPALVLVGFLNGTHGEQAVRRSMGAECCESLWVHGVGRCGVQVTACLFDGVGLEQRILTRAALNSGHNALAHALFQGKCDWEPADDPRQIQNVKEGKLPSDFKRDWGKAAGGTKYDKRPGSGSNSST